MFLNQSEFERAREQLLQHRLPAWEELPDFGLYMDQVVSLVNRYLGELPGYESRQLTPSMINNYVKQKLLPAPRGKRYGREHVARLIEICLLKTVIPIGAIRRLSDDAHTDMTDERIYEALCRMYAEVNADTARTRIQEDSSHSLVLRCALRASAEQALALAALTPVPAELPVTKGRP